MALAAYRNLMRAARIAFQGGTRNLFLWTGHATPIEADKSHVFPNTGDNRVLLAAQDQIRQGFREKAPLAPTDPELQPAIQKANEVATFLRQNVVQGERQGDGTYSEFTHQIWHLPSWQRWCVV